MILTLTIETTDIKDINKVINELKQSNPEMTVNWKKPDNNKYCDNIRLERLEKIESIIRDNGRLSSGELYVLMRRKGFALSRKTVNRDLKILAIESKIKLTTGQNDYTQGNTTLIEAI